MISVDGKSVVVTGIVAGESRVTAEARLRAAGARTMPAVTAATDLLICGAKVGASKINKAADLGVQVIDWNDISWDGDDDGQVSEKAVAPERAATRQIAPMLAQADVLPAGDGWAHEIKWDGYRCVATVRGGKVSMQSRSDKTDYTAMFPQIAQELAGYDDCVLDGELVVLTVEGGSFAGLSRAAGNGNSEARLIVFDLLEAMSMDLRSLPLQARRSALEGLLTGGTYIGLSPTFDDGEELLAYCAAHGLEGVISKRLSSTYKEGSRDGSWVKTKCRCEQEFVVVGYTAGKGARAATFGALVLAVNNEYGDLILAGKVNVAEPGEQLRILEEMVPRFDRDHVAMTEAESKVATKEGTTWVEPTVVVQAEFQRWTEDDRLWHPSYKGLRSDKAPAEVVREAVVS